MRKQKISEAATIKAKARRALRSLDELLSDKTLPEGIHKQVKELRGALSKTWRELEDEAVQNTGRKGVGSKEIGEPSMENDTEKKEGEEVVAENGYEFIPSSITSFTQLHQAHAAREIACDMQETVEQFKSMLENIFFYSDPDMDKLGAAKSLFEEFIGEIDMILQGKGDGDDRALMAGAENKPTGEASSLAESYVSPVTITEAEGQTNPRGPLEMDVQLIAPGWGNTRDNHYYPAEMLKRDAERFVGAKMYETDHVQAEKSTRTEVSQIKSIIGFTEAGAPIARVVAFDPDFAEKCRNRRAAKALESLECSILADGIAKPFELDGRRGKVVEAITAVSSVDWVTRAGAGGRVLGLAESAADPVTEPEAAPVEESGAPAPVTIQETDGEAQEEPPSSEEQPAQEEQPVSTETPAVEEHPAEAEPAPVFMALSEVSEALKTTNLPGKSVLALLEGQYADSSALNEAIQAEIQRVKEISGSGRPFGLGESSAVQKVEPVSRAKIEETMDQVNQRFGIGR